MPALMIPYLLQRSTEEVMLQRCGSLKAQMSQRRSCRSFSSTPVSRSIIESVIHIGHMAPSGANRKPWRFVAVDDAAIKRKIRLAAEEEERENYSGRFPREWLEALEPIGTGADKQFLEIAPWLVVMFRVDWEVIGGQRVQNYYPAESIGIAAGMFLMACHQIGLASLTHTPSPMKFLRTILQRPLNEKPYLLIPVGYPAEVCLVPDLRKKPLTEALFWNQGSAASPCP